MANGGTGEAVEYNGEGGWYYYTGTDRPVAPGTSGADERFASDGSYALIQALQADWFKFNELAKAAEKAGDSAKAAEYYRQRDMCNVYANQIRGLSGYSGGTDGSMHIPNGQLGIDYKDGFSGSSSYLPVEGMTGGGSGSGSSSGSSSLGSQNSLREILDAWLAAAQTQSNGQIDYAVQQAITELQRALEDAQPQFKEQAESVSIDERNAMDNAALYAELRGDRGGIGQEQYSSIQNTAAQNRLAVQQAQTKLATDTERQIADLRAQGEFEKADAALELTQTYLAQLLSLEQWAAEHNLSVEQFNAQLQQWELEYQLALKQLDISQTQWQKEFDFAKDQYADSLASESRNQMANIAWSLLQAGVELDANQLEALGISADQASKLLLQAQMQQESGTSSNAVMDYDGLFEAAKASGHPQSFIANNYKKYGFTSSTGLYSDYQNWEESVPATDGSAQGSLDDLDLASVVNLNIGALSYEEIERMVQMGALVVVDSGEKVGVKWADGWNAKRWNEVKNDPLMIGFNPLW